MGVKLLTIGQRLHIKKLTLELMRTSIILFLIIFIFPVRGQELPAMKDWFLPIGDWGLSPELYVAEIGTGSDTVIMLHGGWGADHKGLISAIAGLENEFHFVLYDQRGSLHSPCPDSLITFNNHIEDLERLRKALKMNKMNLVGHSMGSVLASAYAKKYPERIARLTLITPAHLKTQFSAEEKQLSDAQFENQGKYMNRSDVDETFRQYGLNDKNLSPQQNTAKFRINFARRMLFDLRNWPKLSGGRSLYQGHVYDLTAQSYPPAGWNYIREFNDQTYPVHFIGASHDFLDFGNGLIRKWATEVPRSTIQIISEAGHILWVDQPDAFRKALRTALR